MQLSQLTRPLPGCSCYCVTPYHELEAIGAVTDASAGSLSLQLTCLLMSKAQESFDWAPNRQTGQLPKR